MSPREHALLALLYEFKALVGVDTILYCPKRWSLANTDKRDEKKTKMANTYWSGQALMCGGGIRNETIKDFFNVRDIIMMKH